MGLFEPDVLVTEEWGATFRCESALSSEKRLMLAVLKNALQSYQKYVLAGTRQEAQLFEEVAEWIDSPRGDWFFSFENICENLGINPVQLRRRLWMWRDSVRSDAPIISQAAL